MPAWRKKKCRNIELDFDELICKCFWPMHMDSKTKKNESIYILPEEIQTLVYQDIDQITMAVWCKKMGISKTVYAGIYQSAKSKIVDAIINNKILLVKCDKQ